MAIDVGNTNVTIGLFAGERLARTWRLRTRPAARSDEWGRRLKGLVPAYSPGEGKRGGRPLAGIIVASVVPALNEPLRRACVNHLGVKPMFVTSRLNLGIRNTYRRPREVGADRLVNAAEVHALYEKAAIVVDFGTATTFDCITARGDYLGGAICPGLELAGEWLAEHTAKLPRVTFQRSPPHVLGRTTKESLRSGLFWGYTSLIDGLLSRLKRVMGSHVLVVLTGGLSSVIGPYLKESALLKPDLTLMGLKRIWTRNQPRRRGKGRTP